MTTADQYVSAAAKHIGVSGTDNIFNTWMYGKHVYDGDKYPWCAAFQSYVAMHDCGMAISKSASAAGVANQGTRVDDSKARKGDWVVFNWDGRNDTNWCDHIGLVEWFDHGTQYFGTIEGNCDDQVQRCTRYNEGSYFTAFFRPPYSGSTSKTAVSDPVYKVEVESGASHVWLPEMVGLKDSGGSSDDFAGDGDKPVTALAVKGVGKYRVRTSKHGYLDYVTGYDSGDVANGYAGYEHSPIVAVHIPSTKFKVQVRRRGKKAFDSWVKGRAAGDGKTPIVGIRIAKA